MLAAFLPPYPFRGVTAPFLWWYYRLLGRWSSESAYFITGRAYAGAVNKWHGRWECTPDAQRRLGYRLPEEPQPARHFYAWLDEDRFGRWLAEAGGNPILVFRRFLTQRDESFEYELRGLLAAAPAPLEAVLTMCNVPALEAACAELAIPVIHVELGPLRAPLYRETAYVDFRGVNGNTECASRYHAWHGGPLRLDRGDMLHFFAQGMPDLAFESAHPETDLGVVLQVEDDSNLVAFGNGMENVGLLAAARLDAAAQELSVRVRPHPGSMFALHDASFPIDDSPDSFKFVQCCARLLIINSSVGLEAILLERPVEAFGDCSFGFILDSGNWDEQVRRLVFYLLAYLVPFALQLEPEYLRFRLGRPAEEAVIIRHLEEYMKQQGLEDKLFHDLPTDVRAAALVVFASQARQAARAEERIANLEREVAERDRRIEGFLGSVSWRITAPIRWLHLRVFRRSASR